MSLHEFPSSAHAGLDPAATRAAVAALFATDAVAGLAASRAVDALLGPGADWATLAAQLDGGGLVARYRQAPLATLLEEPGELILVRRADAGHLLLHRLDPHWRAIGADGTPSATVVTELAGDGVVDAVVLRLPHGDDPAVTALSELWPLLKPAWMEVGLASLFINGGLLLLPLFSMLVYDKVVDNGVFETLWALVLGMLVYLAMDTGMRIVRAWSIERVAADLAQRSDERLWQRLQQPGDFAGGSVAAFLADYRNLAAARDFVSASYLMGVADLPFLVLYLLVIGIIAWPLLILVLVLALVYGLAGLSLQGRINRLGKESEQAGTHKLAQMSEALNALDVLRTAPAAHLLLRRWRALAAQTAGIEARRRLAAANGVTLAFAMSTLTTLAVLTLGAYLIDARMLSVGGLIAATMLATRGMGLVATVFSLISKWEDFRRSAERVEASLGPAAPAARVDKPQALGRIDVIGLARRYEGRPAALDDVSLAIAPGERIALVGRPGSGKTTLLRCLAGLTLPDAGQVLVDGVALGDLAAADRARWLAFKAQDPALFAGTLDDNLRVAGVTADAARLAQAIWASGLEDELHAGRMSLGMQLAERGANLSGGQRQKVALARALAQNSRILLLDEPTLGLDPDGERLLAERLPQVVGDGVLVVSTHSATLLGIVRRIVALDAGRIVADGPKERLLRGSQAAA